MRLKCLIGVAMATTVAFGSTHAEDIALSLVRPTDRIDIPTSAITRVEALAKKTFRNVVTGEPYQIEDPRVQICYSEEVRRRICQLTRRIVGQLLEIVVACKTVSKPVVREPVCSETCFEISRTDLAEATALAQQIRSGTKTACPSTN
jgi:preprotein translocase subunit SecD